MTPVLPRSSRPWLLLRVALAAALLFFSIRFVLTIEGQGLRATVVEAFEASPARAALAFLLALALYGAMLLACTRRFLLLLRGAGVEVGFVPLLRGYVVSSFFNLVLPGAVLGDVYRVYAVRGGDVRGSKALGLVLLERILGFASLATMALVALPAIPGAGTVGTVRRGVAVLGASCLAASFAAVHPVPNRAIRGVLRPLRRFFARGVDAVTGALESVAEVATRPRDLVVGLALSFVGQVFFVGAAYALSLPLAAPISWVWFVVVVPVAALAALLPISIGGAGVREFLYVTLFGVAGVPAGQALVLSLSFFAVTIVWGLVGLAVFLIGSARREAGAAQA